MDTFFQILVPFPAGLISYYIVAFNFELKRMI